MELFKTMAGVDMLHIPYKGGGPAMVDLIAGRIQVFLATSVSVGPHLRSGKLKALAVTAQQRKSSLPDISTVTESGLPGYDLSNSYGLHLPVGTPAAFKEAIDRDFSKWERFFKTPGLPMEQFQ
jgi:tripartite-type tricarboxylate transporter receptor subunit TctC